MANLKKFKLGEVAEVFTGFPFKGNIYHDSEGTRVLRGENVTIGSLRWDTIKFWNDGFEEFDKYSLEEKDIVIGMDGSRVGKNRAQIRSTDLPLLLAQRVARIRAKNEFNQDFLAHIIKSQNFERYVKAVHTGTSIPHISATQIKDFEFKATADPKEEKGIKQTWLAEQLGKSYNMVNGYVQNRQQPRLETLYEIAKILKIDVKELLKSNSEN